jgi:hypothetical protein
MKYTKVVKATTEFPTLRSTIPRSIVKHFKIQQGDILSWQTARLNGEKVAILTKYETNTPFTMTGPQKFELTNGPISEPE